MKGIFWNKGWNKLSVQDIVFSLLSPVGHTVHRGFSANSFFYESAGDQKSVKQQKRDNTSVDHTVSYVPPRLYSNMPEEENQNDCFPKSSHVPPCASLGESDKRAKLSVNEIRISKGSGESAWSLLQISPCSRPLYPAETLRCPRSCCPGRACSTYHKPLDFTPRTPGGRSVGAAVMQQNCITALILLILNWTHIKDKALYVKDCTVLVKNISPQINKPAMN